MLYSFKCMYHRAQDIQIKLEGEVHSFQPNVFLWQAHTLDGLHSMLSHHEAKVMAVIQGNIDLTCSKENTGGSQYYYYIEGCTSCI